MPPRVQFNILEVEMGSTDKTIKQAVVEPLASTKLKKAPRKKRPYSTPQVV